MQLQRLQLDGPCRNQDHEMDFRGSGLSSVGTLKKDLEKEWGEGYWQTHHIASHPTHPTSGLGDVFLSPKTASYSQTIQGEREDPDPRCQEWTVPADTLRENL